MADFLDRYLGEEEKIRRLRTKELVDSGGRSETKTFVIGGTITNDLVVPPAFVSVNPDGATPETKRLYGIWFKLGTGSVRVECFTTDYYDYQDVTAAGGAIFLPAYDLITLYDGDQLRISFLSASSGPAPNDLAVGFVILLS